MLTWQVRFLSKVKIAGPDDCWEWTAGQLKDGYGYFRLNGKTASAHRVSYLLFKGEVPPGLYVCHRCDNPGCCNPAHLFAGTGRENALDREAKGRGHDRRGENQGNSKLRSSDVVQIRSKHSAGASRATLAAEYGVNWSTIDKVVRRESWSHV
jgi:hypothetical protein